MSMKKLRGFVMAASIALFASSASAVEMVRVGGQTPEEERCHRHVKESSEKSQKPYSQLYNECAEQFKDIAGTKTTQSANKGKAEHFVPIVQ